MSPTSPPGPDGMTPLVDRDRHSPVAHAPAAGGATASVGLWASLLVLVRHWPVVVLGLILTLAAGVAVVKVVPVSYAATGTLLINLPSESVKADTKGSTVPLNPYIGTRGFVGDLLITIMADSDAEARVAARGGTGAYKTTLSLGDAALVKVDTTGKTADETLATWTATADETKSALIRLQKAKNVPDSQLITAEPLTRPIEAQKESGSRIRALIAVYVLGFAATIFIGFGAESMSQFRRLRRRARARPAAPASTTTEPRRSPTPDPRRGSFNGADDEEAAVNGRSPHVLGALDPAATGEDNGTGGGSGPDGRRRLPATGSEGHRASPP
jgi:hypothetical protein